ncbi:MAG: type II toxin-antitoxin system HicB family antitoxin [Candidatus Poribacteria bacterium]|nr:type II toxin-antitoxin system HicB family antitoxin [Candidatus Poribacteria bacterium]
MDTQTYIYWQDEKMFIGYLETYPDYWTQGESVEALEENLRDIYADLTSGAIPCARKVAQLQIA